MSAKKVVYRKDYTPPPFLVDAVDLTVELDPAETLVTCVMQIRANGQDADRLEMPGEGLDLLEVLLDGQALQKRQQYIYKDGLLVLPDVPDVFTLTVKNRIAPEKNTALEGLYLSSGNYCTQCEAEGFRRITCYPDRPDVMAMFTTTVIGDRRKCPVLLSNGNLVETGDLADGRHFARWHDPFPKPSYLFALVAGDLVSIQDTFTTMSGREVDLFIYVEARNREKCAHAMRSLKEAMRWDEEQYGREYDLDRYMIVAVDDFNMGAMENKGLNIFNSKYVLARPETATDMDYEGIEGVIAHEYFHNWTGNRITCRDWFQLSLKEGLTVFRDQQFSADMSSRPVKRIHDVNVIRSFQFREDSGPMAHPVRPDSFVEINNFYTLTVYNKGAEVIRMIHTLLGPKKFRRGMDLYFERHDGQAVTCDDFVRAMEDAAGVDLGQFKRWYSQAGTPEITVRKRYDRASGKYTIELRQYCPPTPGQEQKEPFCMPVRMALLGNDGTVVVEDTLILKEEEQRFSFQIPPGSEEPVCSLLRDFSAPVKLKLDYRDRELAFLMAHDTDPFNRWDAGQQLAMKVLLGGIALYQAGQGEEFGIPEHYHHAFSRLLDDQGSEPAFLALALTLPSENWISQQLTVMDPDAVFFTRQHMQCRLARRHGRVFLARYNAMADLTPYQYCAEHAGKRSLKNVLLEYLLAVAPGETAAPDALEIGIRQYRKSDNMTDALAALRCVVNGDRGLGDELLADFYAAWQNDPLVIDKWLSLQAACPLPGTLDRVKELTGHPAFSIKNPNKVRALIGSFCSANHWQFHALDGSGYDFLTDYVLRLDAINPQIAARLVTPFTLWRRFDAQRQALMKKRLEQIAAKKDLSDDVREIIDKSLENN